MAEDSCHVHTYMYVHVHIYEATLPVYMSCVYVHRTLALCKNINMSCTVAVAECWFVEYIFNLLRVHGVYLNY